MSEKDYNSPENYENEERQAQEIRDRLAPLEGSEPLPESLSKHNIEEMLKNSPQEAYPPVKKTGIVRRFAALTAAAAVFVLCCVGVAGVFSGTNTPARDNAEATKQQEASVNESTEAPVSVSGSDYSHILSLINTAINRYEYKYYSVDEGESSTIQASSAKEDLEENGAGIGSADDYSETNLQVAGIDEADIIKTDGKFIYAAAYDDSYSEKKIYIVDAQKLTVVSKIEIESYENDYSCYINNFYLRGDTLIVIFSDYASDASSSGIYKSAFYKASCGYKVFDITDRAKPTEIDSFKQDGGYVSSRITDGRLLLISSNNLCYTICCDYIVYNTDDTAQTQSADVEYTAEQVIPKLYDRESAAMIPADRIHVTDEDEASVFTVVTSTPLDDLSVTPDGEAILGSSNEIYCSADRLYVMGYSYESDYPEDSEADANIAASYSCYTKISAFDIGSLEIGYIGTCKARGEIINSYSADEYDGYFRIATCENSKSYITVFNSELKQVGITKEFGIDEQLRSVRFMGNTAYAVTFLQTDPLFIIDLSTPTEPKITGEIKIPGFSEYLHPIGNNLLVGLGLGGTEDGEDGSAKISLFDVSDPANPKEISVLIIENANFDTRSLAFVAVSDGSFIVPLTLNSLNVDQYGAAYKSVSGLLRFAVEDGKLTEKNRYINPEDSDEWYSLRGAYIGNTVYSVATNCFRISSFDLESGEMIDSLS